MQGPNEFPSKPRMGYVKVVDTEGLVVCSVSVQDLWQCTKDECPSKFERELAWKFPIDALIQPAVRKGRLLSRHYGQEDPPGLPSHWRSF